jgi:hypothetical protein
MAIYEPDLAAQLQQVQQRMAAACRRAARDVAGVQLLAVTKGQPPERVRAAAELGLTTFGENRVQEAKAKIPLCPSGLRWHMIGHLQSNKCRDAVACFDVIEGIDSVALATEVSRWAGKLGRRMPILLEVNVAGEASKYGFKPAEVLAVLEEINRLERIELAGLMTIAPWTPEPEKVRPCFRRLRELRERGEQQLGAPLPHLSMGMSGDFEVAIEEGASLIRLGTVLFGERPAKPTSGG